MKLGEYMSNRCLQNQKEIPIQFSLIFFYVKTSTMKFDWIFCSKESSVYIIICGGKILYIYFVQYYKFLTLYAGIVRSSTGGCFNLTQPPFNEGAKRRSGG